MSRPDTTRDRDRFAGFSSDELFRRAQVLRDVAAADKWERTRLEQLARDHEDAARLMRRKENAEDA
jgi:hypothetical protein